MNIKIKNSIIEILRPVTATVEKLQKEHIIENMLQDVLDALNDD